MIEVERLLAFVAAAAVLAAIPGPGMLYVAARTLSGGRRAGLLSTAGTAVGGLVHVVAAAAGLSALLATSSVAFSVVKYAGAAYLIYLGVRTLLRREADRELLAADQPANTRGAFRQGVLTEALNPKTALFFLAFVPQFLNTEAGSVWWQALLLGLISVTLNTLADVVAVALTSTVRAKMPRRGERPVRWPRFASGGALIALGGYAAVES
ncbi:LysE family translocator [Tenggerimyces flavus]|uniref:LysE family translocator n=1 Tax=Tenggerimyces flavus TaxID=1708749 RepID=A0ABV7YN45_9ACTN|nr:LysE family translocator [Tenggerimyces flavus]MBM7787343.1 threonine/homoserine/homoserine lactone efflux protein [Tenggerimyces flavus]